MQTCTNLETIRSIDWQASFEVGIHDIDLQHQFFLNLINRLVAAFNAPLAEEQQEMLIAELSAYARFHFISEESIMVLEGYPDYAEHKQAHLQLLDQLSSRVNMLSIGDVQEPANLIGFLTQWFFTHTNQMDKRLAIFLVEHNGKI